MVEQELSTESSTQKLHKSDIYKHQAQKNEISWTNK
jgi:hypothetical protein